MIGLTRRQQNCLAFLKQYIADKGIPPSFDEIKDFMGLRSKSGIHRLIISLEERGLIRRMPSRARSLEIVDPNERHLSFLSTEVLVALRTAAYKRSMAVETLAAEILTTWVSTRVGAPDAWGRYPSHPLYQVSA